MIGRVASLLTAAVAALIVLLAVLTIVPEERDLAVQAYVLLLGAMVLLWLVGGARAANPTRSSSFDEARRPRSERVERLPELARIEREVALGTSSAFDLHHRLRGRVREVAGHRLASRRGIDLNGQPEAARAVLSPALWELVRPDRPAPVERFGPGLGRDQLREVIDGLDRI
ncbi:MAG: hypothetical protein ABR583_11360 [Gaiellaceae bacterium]